MHPYPILISPYEIPVVLFGFFPARALKCIYLCRDERSVCGATKQDLMHTSVCPPSSFFSTLTYLPQNDTVICPHHTTTFQRHHWMLILLPPYSPAHSHLAPTLDSVSWMQLDSMLLNFHSVRFSFGTLFDGFWRHAMLASGKSLRDLRASRIQCHFSSVFLGFLIWAQTL